MEIRNYTNNRITVTISERINVYSLLEDQMHDFDFFNWIISYMSHGFTKKTENIDIEKIITSSHSNNEEKNHLIILSTECEDIFYQGNQNLSCTTEIKHNIKAHTKFRYIHVHKDIPVYTKRKYND